METLKIDEDIEYLDEFFPKGKTNSKRGYALVLLALARKQGREEKQKEIDKNNENTKISNV